jgi:hypothetical protein
MLMEIETNSDQYTPSQVNVDEKQLDTIINKYEGVFNLGLAGINGVLVSDSVDYSFHDEDGEIDGNDDLNRWELSSVLVGSTGAHVVFSHKNDGTEMFCCYTAGINDTAYGRVGFI